MESLVYLAIVSTISLVRAEYHVSFELEEEKAVSFLVGNVATTSRIRSNMTADEYSSLRYSFLEQNKYTSLFTINPDTSELFPAVVIDRESECSFQETCALRFDVAAHSSVGSRFIIISVEIFLKDINDKVPMFPSNEITRDISESAIIGTPIILDEAADLDSTLVNRILTYDMVSNNDRFTFSVTQKDGGGHDLKLILNASLDRELVDSYKILVTAKDSGESRNTGTLTVNINVKDYNDNPPVFRKDIYSKSVPENAGVGFSIVRVEATDDDIGENGDVVYKLNPRQANLDKIQELFQLNETTGELWVKGSLEYESGKLYDVSIEASDKGAQPKTDHTVVKVTILDVVNNSPQVKVNFLLPHNAEQVNISEASNVGTVIAHVTAEDTDSGANGNVTCSISPGVFGLQTVTGKGYIIVVERRVDRETTVLHNISVTCSDQGTPPLSSSENFLVKVIDFNDNAPQFYQAVYHGSVTENGQIGDVITQVRAWDKDQGQNANITYAIDRKDSDKFAINQYTGVVTTNMAFDRETKSQYSFIVLAIDQGAPSLTGSTSVTLTILDQNDNKPSFDVPMFQFFVMENLGSDATVGSLSASDIDEGDNSKILYEMHENYRGSVPFQVFPDGTIKTTESLDREYQSKHEFHINAIDQGIVKLTASIAVKIYVADDNDNRPIVTFPGHGNETASVSYLAQIGTVVTQVRAYDLDEHGPNSQLRFSIISGNKNDVFSIGENSGKIYLKRTHSIASDTLFRLRVNVSDMNTLKTLFTMKDVNIILTYSNGTASQALSDPSSRNVLIVVGFVAFTAVLSIVIITVICILRRNETKGEKPKTPYKESAMYSPPPEVTKDEKFGLPGGDNSVETLKEIPKKRKEVSFSFDDDVDSVGMHWNFSDHNSHSQVSVAK